MFTQIWRLVTNFLFLGRLSFNFIIRLSWIIQNSCPLESQSAAFQFEPADFLWMLCINGGLLIAASPFTNFVFNGGPLIMSVIYLWSRHFPDQHVRALIFFLHVGLSPVCAFLPVSCR